MTTYTGLQSVLNAKLGDYAGMGFSLREPCDHFTQLLFKDHVIANFNSTKLTTPMIHSECEKYLRKTR